AFSARLAVRAQRGQVVLAVLAGAAVLVRVAPGVPRDVLLQVRALPAGDVPGVLLERLEALLGGRVPAGIQLELVEGRSQELDLHARGRLPGLADPPEEPGAHDRRQDAED